MAFIRVLQILVPLAIVPMMALGLMSMLSGGGMTPAYQQIGRVMLWLSPLAGIAGLILSLVLWHFGQSLLAYLAILTPLLVWAGLLLWLQIETGFFR
jgi:hypothetical protein